MAPTEESTLCCSKSDEPRGTRGNPSAQADIAFSQPRIHSPGGLSACSKSDEPRGTLGNLSAQADIAFSQPRIHSPIRLSACEIR
jgi:hypothetical protein